MAAKEMCIQNPIVKGQYGEAALSGGKAVGRGIMNGARLIFRK